MALLRRRGIGGPETTKDVNISMMSFRASVDFIVDFLILPDDASRCARVGNRSGMLFSVEEHRTVALLEHFYFSSRVFRNILWFSVNEEF